MQAHSHSHNLHYSHGTSNSNGVLIALPKSIDIEVVREVKDDCGRFLILDIKYEGEIYTIGNIYAPTRNFEELQISTLRDFISQLFHETQSTNLISCGDWNLYLSLLLDKLDSMPVQNDNPLYRDEIKSFLEVNNFVDVWRIMNPYERVFTWHRGAGGVRYLPQHFGWMGVFYANTGHETSVKLMRFFFCCWP